MAEENEVLESWEELDNNEVQIGNWVEPQTLCKPSGRQTQMIQHIEYHFWLLNKKLQGIKVRDPSDERPIGPVCVLQEEGGRTQYTPQVRILKRDADPGPIRNTPKTQAQPQKSLQQREAEYNEARLRILGEGYSNTENTNNSATPQQETSRPVKLIQHSEDTKSEKVQILREPKGPDGSQGFNQER